MTKQIWSGTWQLAVVLLVTAVGMPAMAGAQRYDTRREIREGHREVNHERREARREIVTADSPMERRHEIREGAREVSHERREAERQVRRTVW